MDLRPALLALLLLAPAAAWGHGNPTETVGPLDIGGRLALLEVSSSASDPALGEDQQVSISLLDAGGGRTLRGVELGVRAERGEELLFDRQFRAEHGFVVFNFASSPGPVRVAEEDGSGFFASLLGFESRLVRVEGPGLADGGLYKFAVSVLAAEGASPAGPAVFSAGVSVPQTTRHHVSDPNYGPQHVDVITYYDAVSGFAYDPDRREISYHMPFEWTEENINQTLVVHEEVAFPPGFGDLLASGFEMDVNGVRVSEEAVNVDDFAEERVVHFTIFREELLRLMAEAGEGGMSFAIRPDGPRLSAVTDNGQYRVYAHAPGGLVPGEESEVLLWVTDVFLRDAPAEAEYEMSVSLGGGEIHAQSGTSPASGDPVSASFHVPAGGIAHLRVQLGGSERAAAEIPLVAGRAPPAPEGLREAALAWSRGGPDAPVLEAAGVGGAPQWLRQTAAAWISGEVGSREFAAALAYAS